MAGFETEFDVLAAGLWFETRVREEVVLWFAESAERLLRKEEGILRSGIEVYQDEDFVFGVMRFSFEDEDGRFGSADAAEGCVVEEGWVFGEEGAEAGEFGDDVFGISPGEAAAGMDVYFFGREPFDAAGVAEAATVAGERAE